MKRLVSASLFALSLSPAFYACSTATPIPVHPAAPLEELELNQWHYLEPPGTACANGTPVGYGFSPGAEAEDLVVFIKGGGACWDAPSCHLFHTSANIWRTYDRERLSQELTPIVETGLFDRHREESPWPNANFAFIPYCTGDLHIGKNIAYYDSFAGERPLHHVGAENMRLFVQSLAQRAPDIRRLWLVGTSAGGYGATWHYERFQEAFPQAQIHVFSDASPWIAFDEQMWAQWRTNWGVELPAHCSGCDEAPDQLISALIQANPEARFALAAHDRDMILSSFAGILPGEFEERLNWFLEYRFQGANAEAFIASGAKHETLLLLKEGLSDGEGQELSDFLKRWAHGDEPTPQQPLPQPQESEFEAP